MSGEKYSIRSDVWSTGITLLELVQGRFPFPTGLADIELMLYITQNEVRHSDPLIISLAHFFVPTNLGTFLLVVDGILIE